MHEVHQIRKDNKSGLEFEDLPETVIQKYPVPPSCAGLRVDVFLKTRLKKMSRTRIKEMIESGNCYFEDSRKTLTAGTRVETSDVVCLKKIVSVGEEATPQNYELIYSDDDIIVVNKPAGLPVHPTTRYMKGNLLNLLRRDFPDSIVHLCHRIDKETSGILLLARNLESEKILKKEFRERVVKKSYLTIVWGSVEPDRGALNFPLREARGERIRTKMEVAVGARMFGSFKEAITRYRVIKKSKRFTLVECFPETGRQHQIRIHLKHIGHPVVGDKLYSIDEKTLMEFFNEGFESSKVREALVLRRHALHAYSLEFVHPKTSRWLSFAAPLPVDMQELLDSDK